MNKLLSLFVGVVAVTFFGCDKMDKPSLPKVSEVPVDVQSDKTQSATVAAQTKHAVDSLKRDREEFVALVEKDLSEFRTQLGRLQERVGAAAASAKSARDAELTSLDNDSQALTMTSRRLNASCRKRNQRLPRDGSS